MGVSSLLHAPAALPPGKGHLYPLNGRLRGSQSESTSFRRRKNYVLDAGILVPFRSAGNRVTISTELCRFHVDIGRKFNKMLFSMKTYFLREFLHEVLSIKSCVWNIICFFIFQETAIKMLRYF